MKKEILFLIIASTILFGCSTTYNITDFSTKQDYYKDFNNFAENKNLELTLTNDSTIITEFGTYIQNDSLSFVPVHSKVLIKRIPLASVKKVYYKKHWPGIIPGFLLGIPGGLLVGVSGIIPAHEGDNITNARTYDYGKSIMIGTSSGIVIGSVIGWLVGFNYTYQFNP